MAEDLPSLLAESVHSGPWEVTISFGESRSKSYGKAVEIAKMTSQYHETQDNEGNIIHLAAFGSSPNEFLNFVALYEMVGGWKSSSVIINGELVDRKIISQINYCYGDKCRSGRPTFCFGASPMTDNPFGCHRLRIHATHDPWYVHGYLDGKGVFHVDKRPILHALVTAMPTFKFCPSFDLSAIAKAFYELPEQINPKHDPAWVYKEYWTENGRKQGVAPKTIAERSMVAEMKVVLNLPEDLKEKEKKSARGGCCGCLTVTTVLSVLVVAIMAFAR